MTEKKRSSKTSKLKNFLVTGSIEEEEENFENAAAEEEASYEIPSSTAEYSAAQQEEETVVEDIIEAEAEPVPAYEPEPEPAPAPPAADTSALEKEVLELREAVAAISSELGRYATTKEQLKEYSAIVNKRDAELANRKFTGMLEQLSVMREDFFKLCNGMNAKLDSFSAKDILNSFEAYGVDMENILVDCGVEIGQSRFEKLNTIHQRIVDVIPTDDRAKNGMIAERVADGYVYQGRVLLKEKVKIYRFSENGIAERDEEK